MISLIVIVSIALGLVAGVKLGVLWQARQNATASEDARALLAKSKDQLVQSNAAMAQATKLVTELDERIEEMKSENRTLRSLYDSLMQDPNAGIAPNDLPTL